MWVWIGHLSDEDKMKVCDKLQLHYCEHNLTEMTNIYTSWGGSKVDWGLLKQKDKLEALLPYLEEVEADEILYNNYDPIDQPEEPKMKKMKFDVSISPKLSTRVQEKLFKLGYSWVGDNRNIVKYTDQNFLLTYEDGDIYFSNGYSEHFHEHNNEEVCPYEFTGIPKPSEMVPDVGADAPRKISDYKILGVDLDNTIQTELSEEEPKKESVWDAHKAFMKGR